MSPAPESLRVRISRRALYGSRAGVAGLYPGARPITLLWTGYWSWGDREGHPLRERVTRAPYGHARRSPGGTLWVAYHRGHYQAEAPTLPGLQAKLRRQLLQGWMEPGHRWGRGLDPDAYRAARERDEARRRQQRDRAVVLAARGWTPHIIAEQLGCGEVELDRWLRAARLAGELGD